MHATWTIAFFLIFIFKNERLSEALPLVSEAQQTAVTETVSSESGHNIQEYLPWSAYVLGTKRDRVVCMSAPFLFFIGRCLIPRHGAQLWGRSLRHGERRCREALQ